jgi:response regulator RpfG family c-di-GMP phosphodiesterase
MYGLTHRMSTIPHGDHASPGPLRRVGARATVVVIESDPSTLVLVRRAVADDYRIVIACDAADALALVDHLRPEVLVFDVGLTDSEVAMVTVALAACDHLDSMPAVMLDPHEPMNAITLRARIDEAVRVSRRVFLGGGLHQRFATAA